MLKPLFDEPKIDTHFHSGGWNVVQPAQHTLGLSRILDRYSIMLAVTSSTRALNDALEAGNAETARLCADDPRFRGLVVVNPLEPEKSLAEMDKYQDDSQFVGIKTIQDFYGLGLDDPRYSGILDKAANWNWPVMAHTGGMVDVAGHWPMNFIAAHATHGFEPLLRYANVYFDIATSPTLKARCPLAELIRRAGRRSVLFSSDAPLIDPALTLGKLASLDLGADTLAQIFRQTALIAFPRLREAPSTRLR